LRLCGRFRRLAARKDSKNLVVTAIARELTGFLWAEMAACHALPAIGHRLDRRHGDRQPHAAPGHRRGRTDPASTLRRPPRRARSQGTFLQVADLRFRPAYISVAVHRSTMPRRGVPITEPGPSRDGSSTSPMNLPSRTTHNQHCLHLRQNHATDQGNSLLDKPLHISTPTALVMG
jgi:hypothetical protein